MEPIDKMEKKITQLHLNTPGACFLCLQDNERDDEGDPVDHLNGGIIDLTNICRYLNIDQFSLLLAACKNDGGAAAGGVEDIVCTFSVNLCSKCLDLTQKLNDKIIALEKAKLMVNFHLHSFHKLLEENKTAEIGERIDLEEKMNTNLETSLEAKLVQLLRKEAQQKSFKFLRKAEAAMPQIILSKCQVPPPLPRKPRDHPHPSQEPPPLSEPPLSSKFPSPPSSLPPPSPELLPSSDPPQIPSTPPAGTSVCIKTLLRHLTTTSVMPSKKSRQSKLPLYRCPYCAKILTHPKFPSHLCCLHSDKLLSPYFPPSQPPSELICRQVLQTKVFGNAVKIKSSTPSRPRLACHLCGKSYSQSSALKHHFLRTHTTQLCEEIKEFGKRTASKSSQLFKTFKTVKNVMNQLLETSVINPTNDDMSNAAKVVKRHQCPFCRISFVSSNFALHLANLHPEKLLEHFIPSIDKKRDDNPNYFSQLCSRVLATQVAKAASIPGISSSLSLRYSRKLCCHLCASKYSEGRHLKLHFLVHHTDHICEQLVKMQNVKTKAQDKKKLGEKACTICRKAFPQFDKLRRHQATQHPDQLFLNSKPSWMGVEQFRGICKGIFRREVREATYGKPGDKIYKCVYCPEGKTSYKGQDYLVVHLAYQHRRKIEDKLKQDRVEGREDDTNLWEGDEDGVGDDNMIIEEENASEFDLKPDIGDLDEMVYEDKVLHELISKEDDDLQHQYGYFEENGSDGGDHEVDDSGTTRNRTDEQLELPDNQSASPIIKLEAAIPPDYCY